MSRYLIAALLLVGVSGCSDDPEPTEPSEEVSYYADIQPIMAAHCVDCHSEGAIGQGLLTDYANVAARAPAIESATKARTMPPWLADGECNDYHGDRSLSQEQIDTIARWVAQGAPEGDPSEAPAVQKNDEATGMTRVDQTIEMPVDYEPRLSPDDYRCFIVDWPESETKFVTGIGFNPGNSTTVHHVIAFMATPAQVATYQALDDAEEGPGYTCYGGPGGPNDGTTGFLGGWAPGTDPYDFPAGTGVRVDPGSKVVMQVHYNQITWNGEPDRTSVDVMLADSVDKEAQWAFYANPQWIFGLDMPIPAGDPDVVHSFSLDPTGFFGGAFDMYQVGLHMHTRGTQATLDIVRENSDEACLLDIPRWDFDWQFPYRLKEPVRIDKGDQLRITCHWDNSPENQPSVGGMPMPPQDLNWGEGTNDEMCLGLVYLTTDI